MQRNIAGGEYLGLPVPTDNELRPYKKDSSRPISRFGISIYELGKWARSRNSFISSSASKDESAMRRFIAEKDIRDIEINDAAADGVYLGYDFALGIMNCIKATRSNIKSLDAYFKTLDGAREACLNVGLAAYKRSRAMQNTEQCKEHTFNSVDVTEKIPRKILTKDYFSIAQDFRIMTVVERGRQERKIQVVERPFEIHRAAVFGLGFKRGIIGALSLAILQHETLTLQAVERTLDNK